MGRTGCAPPVNAGTYSMTASFSGNSDYSSATKTDSITVAQTGSAVSLTETPGTTPTYGQSVALSVQVGDTTPNSSQIPTGMVKLSFTMPNSSTVAYICSNGTISTSLCSVPLGNAGKATVSSIT